MTPKWMPMLALGVMACTPDLPIATAPLAVTPNITGASGADVLAASRTAGEPTPDFLGTETVEVRAKANGDEVAGATCTLATTSYNATVITPAAVVIPNYGRQSPAIIANCRYGEMTGGKTVRIVDTRGDQRSSVSLGSRGDGLKVGVRLVLPLGQPDPAEIYDYPDITVPVR